MSSASCKECLRALNSSSLPERTLRTDKSSLGYARESLHSLES